MGKTQALHRELIIFWILSGLIFIAPVAPQQALAQGPTAVTGPDKTITLGEAVEFDGSRSVASGDSRIVTWKWDFDNIDRVPGNLESAVGRHYYNFVGGYTGTLTVTDERGRSDQAWQRIEVLSPTGWGPTLVDRFEGGRSGVVAKEGADFVFYNQWGLQWYFRLDNVTSVPVSIKIFGYGPSRKVPPSVTPYNDDQSFNEAFVPYVNYDFAHPKWERLERAQLKYDARQESLTIRHTFARSPVYLAWSPPYTEGDLNRFIGTLKGNRFSRVETIGKSVEGRGIQLITVTDPASADKEKVSAWFIGQQHGYEMTGGPVCEGIVRSLLDDPSRATLLRKFVFKLVPVVNPDAIAHGGFRYNMHDVDLNRNWDSLASNYADRTESEPEVAAIKRAIAQWVEQGNRFDLFVDLHCHTPLSEGLWLYPAESPLVDQRLFEKEMRFAKEFMNRRSKFSINPSNTPGSAQWFAAAQYGRRTGVISYTSENPLLTISTADGSKILTTPDLYRKVGKEWVEAVRDFFDMGK
jgi:hypothetical protein